MKQRDLRHSVNCYRCGVLADERVCMPNTAEYGGNDDGGDLCPECVGTDRYDGMPCQSIHCRHYDLAHGFRCAVEKARDDELSAALRFEYDCEQPDAQPYRGPNDAAA